MPGDVNIGTWVTWVFVNIRDFTVNEAMSRARDLHKVICTMRGVGRYWRETRGQGNPPRVRPWKMGKKLHAVAIVVFRDRPGVFEEVVWRGFLATGTLFELGDCAAYRLWEISMGCST